MCYKHYQRKQMHSSVYCVFYCQFAYTSAVKTLLLYVLTALL